MLLINTNKKAANAALICIRCELHSQSAESKAKSALSTGATVLCSEETQRTF